MNSLIPGISAILLLLAAVPSPAQWLPLVSLNGATANARFGSSIAGLGDYDNDGSLDVAIGAPGEGKVYVYGGPSGTLITTLVGSAADEFGASISFADLDGVLGSELVVGSPGASSGLGKIEVFDNGSAVPNKTFLGTSAGGRCGFSIATFDSTNDGIDEIAVGVPNADRVVVLGVSGASLVVLCTIIGTAGSDFGFALDGGADFTGDGFADLVVGAPEITSNGKGSVRVYNLVTCSLHCSFLGQANGDAFGYSVTVVGTLASSAPAPNILAGAIGRDFGSQLDVGSVTILNANCVSGCVITGVAAGDQFGFASCATGDVNSDGFADFVIGAPLFDGNGTDSGNATLFSGAALCPSNLCGRVGGNGGDKYGSRMRFVGDFNLDGAPDVAIAAPFADPTGSDSGKVEIVSLPAIPFSLAAAFPLGPGSLQLAISGGAANTPYFLAVALTNAGVAPGGWFFGIDLTLPEFQSEVQAGFPFLGLLDAGGAFTFGPLPGLPSGLTFDTVAIGLTFSFSVTGATNALIVTIP